jgi:hypothetical protein
MGMGMGRGTPGVEGEGEDQDGEMLGEAERLARLSRWRRSHPLKQVYRIRHVQTANWARAKPLGGKLMFHGSSSFFFTHRTLCRNARLLTLFLPSPLPSFLPSTFRSRSSRRHLSPIRHRQDRLRQRRRRRTTFVSFSFPSHLSLHLPKPNHEPSLSVFSFLSFSSSSSSGSTLSTSTPSETAPSAAGSTDTKAASGRCSIKATSSSRAQRIGPSGSGRSIGRSRRTSSMAIPVQS